MNPKKKALHALLRTNLSAFIMKTFHTVDGSQKYVPNWHIELIADKLTRCMKGEIKRLIINLPPRSLKSICASVAFPAWVLGQDPSKKIIVVSYADELALKLSRDCRSVMESIWYRETFPGTSLNPRKRAETDFETTKTGYRLAISVGGAVTGRGGNLIIIDDPLKPQEAMEKTKRDVVNEWYTNTLHSRLNNRTEDALVIVMQRLHLEDLSGFVQDKEDWEVLNLAAIAYQDEEYELFSGEKVGRKAGEVLNGALDTLKSLENVKNTIGEELFEAQYQQNPGIRQGVFEDIKFTVDCDTFSFQFFQVWNLDLNNMLDPGNHVCITMIGGRDRETHIVDVFQDRLSYSQLKKKMLEHQKNMGALHVVFEETQLSRILMVELQAASPKYHWKFHDDDLTKMERLIINAGLLASGNVSVETEEIEQLLVKNLENYPYGGDLSAAEALGMGFYYFQNQNNLDDIPYFGEELDYVIKVSRAVDHNTPLKEIDEMEELDLPTLDKLIQEAADLEKELLMEDD